MKASALIKEIDEGAEGGGTVFPGAGVMLADIPADVVGIDSRRTVGW